MKIKKISIIKGLVSLPKIKIKFVGYSNNAIDNYKKKYKYFAKLCRLKIIWK